MRRIFMALILFSLLAVGCGDNVSDDELQQSEQQMDDEMQELQEQLPADL